MNLRVDPIVMMVVTMFAAAVMAVDPVMAVRPMAWNPDHFIFTLPIARAMAVVWLVAKFDVNSRRCRTGGPEIEPRHDERNE
jgi:hypothetical protein